MNQVKSNPMYRFLAVFTISSTIGLQAWLILFNNFAVEVAGMDGDQVGIIQSVREIPGFLTLLAIFVMLYLKEHRLSAISIIFLGAGLGITGFFPTYPGLLVTTVIMSFGFHYFETTNQSLTLQYFPEKISPWVFGKLRALAAASSIGIGIAVYFLTSLFDYTGIYLVNRGGYCRRRYMGAVSGPERPQSHPPAQEDDLQKKILAFLFSYLYGRRAPADIHGLRGISTCKEIRFHHTGGDPAFCYKQPDKFFPQPFTWKGHN